MIYRYINLLRRRILTRLLLSLVQELKGCFKTRVHTHFPNAFFIILHLCLFAIHPSYGATAWVGPWPPNFFASAQFLLNPDSSARSQSHLGVKQERHVWETWTLSFAYKASFPCLQGSFTCRESTTWDRRLYFPSEGRRAADFITLKIHRPRPGLNPRTLGPVASTLTTRPVVPKRCVARDHEVCRKIKKYIFKLILIMIKNWTND
jgi:hypothetical protein